LLTIDQLWVKYRQGRFGFSVQKKIWLEVGGKVDYRTEKKLGKRVGWLKKGEWLRDYNLTFNLRAPSGHLPWCRYDSWLVNFLINVGLWGWVLMLVGWVLGGIIWGVSVLGWGGGSEWCCAGVCVFMDGAYVGGKPDRHDSFSLVSRTLNCNL